MSEPKPSRPEVEWRTEWGGSVYAAESGHRLRVIPQNLPGAIPAWLWEVQEIRGHAYNVDRATRGVETTSGVTEHGMEEAKRRAEGALAVMLEWAPHARRRVP